MCVCVCEYILYAQDQVKELYFKVVAEIIDSVVPDLVCFSFNLTPKPLNPKPCLSFNLSLEDLGLSPKP